MFCTPSSPDLYPVLRIIGCHRPAIITACRGITICGSDVVLKYTVADDDEQQHGESHEL